MPQLVIDALLKGSNNIFGDSWSESQPNITSDRYSNVVALLFLFVISNFKIEGYFSLLSFQILNFRDSSSTIQGN